MLVKAFQEDYQLKFRNHQIEGPTSPRDYLEWNTRIRRWRIEQQKEVVHSTTTSIYDNPSLQWVQKSYVQLNAMLHDLFLFDPVSNKYTVDKFLKGKRKEYERNIIFTYVPLFIVDVEERYGAIDSIVVSKTIFNQKGEHILVTHTCMPY